MTTRREFIRQSAFVTAGLTMGTAGMAAPKKGIKTDKANDKVRVGIIGFSDRTKHSLIPAFYDHAERLNFEIVAVSDIWSVRREEASEYFKTKWNKEVKVFPNNEALYESKMVDAVIIATADFQHALHCIEAMKAGCDAYVEKPFAETMADNRAARDAVRAAGKIVQVGSQRRSAPNYHAANQYIRDGKFGKIVMVEMCWNVNQPDRWRRPSLCEKCFEKDLDWKRFLLNRPHDQFDPRKYLEYRLFWPYSSGIPGQWMAHQIDTVHWFSGIDHPKSVAANGGIYQWKDGRKNFDTMTAVFDYDNGADQNFQVVYSSRFSNSAGNTKELYYSNGGMLNLDTNMITSEGGLRNPHAKAMNLPEFLLPDYKLPEVKMEVASNTGGDIMTSLHMLNWMECVRSRKEPNAPVDAGYNHSVANIMTTAALRTGEKATFDPTTQEVMAGGKVFQY